MNSAQMPVSLRQRYIQMGRPTSSASLFAVKKLRSASIYITGSVGEVNLCEVFGELIIAPDDLTTQDTAVGFLLWVLLCIVQNNLLFAACQFFVTESTSKQLHSLGFRPVFLQLR